MIDDVAFVSGTEIAKHIRQGEISPVDVVERYLTRIQRSKKLNAYITVTAESARKAATEAERAVEQNNPADLGALHGVPVALKDLTAFKEGIRHTFGCTAFADYTADHTSVFVERLESAGAIVIGKTNTPEFGHRTTTDNLLVGPTPTPFDPAMNAGGSSGGSAAAVAAGLTTLGQGGDAVGSVRIPAALCGVYGLKPSFGRIPQAPRPDAFFNVSPFVDKGPLTRTVDDAAVMLSVMAGPHRRDPFSLPADDTDFVGATQQSIDGVSIAYSPNLGIFPVSTAVESVVTDAVQELSNEGATVTEIEIDFEHSLETLREDVRMPAMNLLAAKSAANTEDAHGLDLLGEDRDAIPEELAERIATGRSYSAMEFERTKRLRTDVFDSIQNVFTEYDLLVTPTVAVAGVENGVIGPHEIEGDPIDPLSDWALTWPFNLSGHPAASIPAGFTNGLPVGMQLIGSRFDDATVLAASATFERCRPWQEAYSDSMSL